VQSNRRFDEGAATVEGRPLPWRIRHFRPIASLPPTPCFRKMSKLLELAGDVPEVSFAPGDVIIEEGKPLNELFLLKSGEVEIRRDDLSIGRIAKIGSAIGEISALLGVPASGTVRALTPCTFAVVKDAASFVTENHEVTVEIARNLASRLAWMTHTYVEQVYDDI
jgi:CRP-like cAMP-binding protein